MSKATAWDFDFITQKVLETRTMGATQNVPEIFSQENIVHLKVNCRVLQK